MAQTLDHRLSPRGWPLAVALAIAVAIQAWLLWPFLHGQTSDFDAIHMYLPLAKALLAEGLDFFSTEKSLHTPPFAYIYPALLGPEIATVKRANFALSFVTLLLVFRTTWLMHSRFAAIAAAFLFALSPLMRPFLASPLSEPPFLFLCAAWIWALAEWQSSGRAAFAIAAGFALGLAILTRGALIYLPVFLVVLFGWLGWRSQGAERTRALWLAAAHGIALILPAVVILHNWWTFSFAFIATGAGNALYLGNNPLTGGYDPVYLGTTFDSGAIAQNLYHLSLAAERQLEGAAKLMISGLDAAFLAKLHAQKLAGFLFITNAETYSGELRVLRSWRIATLVLALIGAWGLRRNWLGWIVVAALGYLIAVHVPVLYTHRYSVSAMDLWLVILAAAGASDVLLRFRARQKAAVIGLLAVAVAAGAYAYRYAGQPQPDVFTAARLPTWEGAPTRRDLNAEETVIEIPIRNAPRFHPWNNYVIVMEGSLASTARSRACGWMDFSFKRDGGADFGRVVRRRLPPDGRHHRLQIGAIVPLQLNAEGILRLSAHCPGGGVLDITRIAVYAPMGALDYRARLLGEPLAPEFER